MPSPLDQLLRRRVIAVLGKGGVGRTSISGALAAFAAGRGKRTLIMETDAGLPIADGYGVRPGPVPAKLASNLWGLFLGGQESLEEYLGLVVPRPVLRAVFASLLYQYFVHAAPAVRELLMMGKVYHEIERRAKTEPPWDLIVFDPPASGQALNMIRMPFAAKQTFGDSIVGREAREVARFFCDPDRCAMVIVTSAEPLAMAETLEIHRALRGLELTTAAVVFNRLTPAAFDSVDIARLLKRGGGAHGLAHLNYLAEIARADLRRKARERRALGIVRRQMNVPIIEIEECRARARTALTTELAKQLAKYSAQAEPAPRQTQA